jgi:hypothetical protein
MHAIELDPRRRFFNEEGPSLPPFVVPGWRGGVLDPDKFNHTKIPRYLFESIMRAALPREVFLRTYTPDSDSSVRLDPSWESFKNHRFLKDNWSLEYVLYDVSGRWAVLLDPDVVVVGAEEDLADSIDQELGDSGTSLEELTHQFFPGLDAAAYNAYFFAVIGARPSGGAP